MAKKNSNAAGIVLLAKQSGLTSYSSLNAVKKALGTSKVGHTGTLDSFAQGLLVVCVGNLTRLSSHITAFNKTYEAVIEFGKETDTLDPTGEVVRTAELPELQALLKAVENFYPFPFSIDVHHKDPILLTFPFPCNTGGIRYIRDSQLLPYHSRCIIFRLRFLLYPRFVSLSCLVILSGFK